jgi:hypothetical protein
VILRDVGRDDIVAFVDFGRGKEVGAAAVFTSDVELVIAFLAGFEENPGAIGVPLEVAVGGAPRIAGAFGIVGQLQGLTPGGSNYPDLPLAYIRDVLAVGRPMDVGDGFG